ncbi:hypothetical protein WICPIJ_000838 [Wickerhamomyces pijperi]|uniref:SUI1 domain-containing protein n=1 Tax=Wickerhamomyces pijperi TaxID=599730 RepID=A0A9P8QD15_WICPI|nr:hypothetical protein WICPIJ_000838 [Wickerhamomyces pijperi]
MEGIQNLKTYDAFNDTGEDQDSSSKSSRKYFHLRIQKRTSKKSITIVEGLPADFDLKKILKFLKQKYACNGNITKDADSNEIIQLQGDQRHPIMDFLIENLGVSKEMIKIHGF